MRKSTHTTLYDAFRARLVAMRKASGMTQRQLARKVARERSFIGRIELGERRLDIVEFFWICEACKQDPVKVATALMKEFRHLETDGRRKAAIKQ